MKILYQENHKSSIKCKSSFACRNDVDSFYRINCGMGDWCCWIDTWKCFYRGPPSFKSRSENWDAALWSPLGSAVELVAPKTLKLLLLTSFPWDFPSSTGEMNGLRSSFYSIAVYWIEVGASGRMESRINWAACRSSAGKSNLAAASIKAHLIPESGSLLSLRSSGYAPWQS